MSIARTVSTLVAAGVLAALAHRAEAQAMPPLANREAALTRSVFGASATTSFIDAPIACRATTGACVPSITHLKFAAAVAVPTVAQCAGTAQPLMTCYAAAIERTQEALDQGSAYLLFEAAQRMKDVAARADASTTAPAWLKSPSTSNLLYKFFKDQGMSFTGLGSCTTGTEAARYACLGGTTGPSNAVYRSAIGILDNHENVLVNYQQYTNAQSRLEQIIRSASAPTIAAMTSANKFDARLGRRLPRMDLFGKLEYLRQLTHTAGTADAELAYFDQLPTFATDPAHPKANENLMIWAAARLAVWTNPATNALTLLDAAIDADLRTLETDLDIGVELELMRGSVSGATVAGSAAAYMAQSRSAAHFDAVGTIQRWNGTLDGFPGALFSWRDGQLSCDWFTLIDHTISITEYYPVTTTQTVKVPNDCLPKWDDDCDPNGYTTTTITTTTWVQGATTVLDLGTTIVADSIRADYKDLLDADPSPGETDDIFVPDEDGEPAIDLEDDGTLTNGTIARTGIEVDACLEELSDTSGDYEHERTEVHCGVGDDCEDEYGGTDGRMFIPYALASRVCPDFVGYAVGIPDVVLQNGRVTGESVSCPRPLEFVAHLADTLQSAPADYIEAIKDKKGAIGALLEDFQEEAKLLTVPAAGIDRQQADLAYFSAEPLSGCDDLETGDCVGLDVLAQRLDTAADAVGKGLALYRQFSEIDRTDSEIHGNLSIADYTTPAVVTCQTGGVCEADSKTQIRALGYRRLRDALDIYQETRVDQIEVLTRQMDGMPVECIVTTDSDADGVDDAVACDAANPACTDFCPYHDDLVELAATTDDDLTDIGTDLQAQLDEIEALGTSAALESLVSDLITWTSTMQSGVDARVEAAESGVDWLHERKGRWAVVIPAEDMTVAAQVDADLTGLLDEASTVSTQYDGWVDAYMDDISRKASFGAAADQAQIAVDGGIAAFCTDENGDPEADGCGIHGHYGPDDTNSTAEAINDVLTNDFCQVSVAATPEISADLDALAADDPYVEWATSENVPTCPHLDTYDLDGLLSNFTGGSLIEDNVLDMKAKLAALTGAIADYHAYVSTMKNADQLFEQYIDDAGTYDDQKEAFKHWLEDTLVCGGAVLTAIAGAETTVGDIALWVGAAATCTARFVEDQDELFPDNGHISEKELNFEASLASATLTEADLAYNITSRLETVILRIQDYQDSVRRYQGALADYQGAITRANETLDSVGDYEVFDDSTYQEFQLLELTTMKGSFRGFARDLQDRQREVEYDMGNEIPEGTEYARNIAEHYWMPRIADITVASPSQNVDVLTAYTSLDSTFGEPQPQEKTLVGTASLLQFVYDDFREVYERRINYVDGDVGYIGSAEQGLVDLDGDGLQDVDANGARVYNNLGEQALLGDSRFYDPSGVHGACADGWAEIADYCPTLTDGTATTATECADVDAMPVIDRLSAAYADHMMRTPGHATFDCTSDAAGYHVAVRRGSLAGAFTSADLPPWNGDGSAWHKGVVGVADETLYAAQTPVVQALIDLYLDRVNASDAELSASMRVYPGNYLLAVDMSAPTLDPEYDVMTSPLFARESQSEQLDGLAVLCTSSAGCGAGSMSVDNKPVDVALLGPGYKGTRCMYEDEYASTYGLEYERMNSGPRQAQLEFLMDDDLLTGTVQTLKTTLPDYEPLVEDTLAASSAMQRPLHVGKMLFSIYGIYDANGSAQDSNLWALYLGDATPRLRIAVDYSYYSTDATQGPQDIDIGSFLACPDHSEPI
jgi:hypothetical protein